MHNAITQFSAAIRAAGLEPPKQIKADGELHRFAGNGKAGDDSGYYVLHLNGVSAGMFGCWRTGLKQSWRADIGRELTTNEEAAHRATVEKMRQARKAEEQRRHTKAAARAVKIWTEAEPAPDDYPYLARKGIKAHGVKLYKGSLVIPMYDAGGALCSLQFIDADGSKRFLKDGKVKGCYYLIGETDGATALYIAEGFATAATIHEVTGLAVTVAFNAGNLDAVAKAMRTKFPALPLIVCADDDYLQECAECKQQTTVETPYCVHCGKAHRKDNTGLTKADAAALAVGGNLIKPEFGTERGDPDTDFNDLMKLNGLDAVRVQILAAVGSIVPSKPENEEVSLLAPNPTGEDEALPGDTVFISDFENSGGTGGTGGTSTDGAACSGSTEKTTDGTGGTDDNKDDDKLEQLDFDGLDMPGFIVRDEWFKLGGVKRKPGVWYCYHVEGKKKDDEPIPKAVRICSPLYIDGVTNTENGQYFGRLLRFRDTLGRWRKWAMPMELLRGSCEELRGELLAAGVEIEQQNRNHLATYLQWRTPKTIVTAATRTGWTQQGGAFVLQDRIIGAENVHFQSENIGADGAARSGGSYRQWQAMAALCECNPVLIVSLCVSLAGALLAKVHRDSGGVHWVGDSSTGKTTALIVGASVWGGTDFKRTWRATSNGLEGVAALLSDTCLCLDEINEADPREVGAIVYSLGNGTGKTRATRIGSARQAHRWRLSLLSTGERSISAAMQEGGKQAKAGQLVRLLNIPAARQYGVFDELHGFSDGRQFADHFKTECARHYGHAGMQFVEYILKQGHSDFGATLAKLEAQFSHDDTQAARAASRFALYAMAGEMAIEAGIVPWKTGVALEACKVMFEQWGSMRGSGATEHRQILQNVTDYILKHGDNKFTHKNNPDEKSRTERAGWYVDKPEGRVYLFTSAALKEAGGNYDFNRVLDALDSAVWIAERDYGLRRKKTAITGGGKPGLYWILPNEDADHAG